MTDTVSSTRIAFLNRLLSSAEGWRDASSLLGDFCAAFGAKNAGVRWPADGPAVLLAETARVANPDFQCPLVHPELPAGAFWVDGVSEADGEMLALTANALVRSSAFSRLLGPAADQAKIAQRLEDAARVAGRVAHDMDNVFQGVSGFTALTLELLQPGTMPYQNLTEADTATRAGMKLCSQLHQLSQAGRSKPMPSSPTTALTREVHRATKAHPKAKFDAPAPADLPSVWMDNGSLQMVIGHLLDNAAEASPAGGTVTVSARLVELAGSDLQSYIGCPAPGPNVELTVSDRGPGASDDARRRMFVEPFFTTKVRHRGLSLTVVYRILYAHRGGARVESTPGQGTTIKVVVPVAHARTIGPADGRTIGGGTV